MNKVIIRNVNEINKNNIKKFLKRMLESYHRIYYIRI